MGTRYRCEEVGSVCHTRWMRSCGQDQVQETGKTSSA
jgi:hypothetical protein